MCLVWGVDGNMKDSGHSRREKSHGREGGRERQRLKQGKFYTRFRILLANVAEDSGIWTVVTEGMQKKEYSEN